MTNRAGTKWLPASLSAVSRTLTGMRTRKPRRRDAVLLMVQSEAAHDGGDEYVIDRATPSLGSALEGREVEVEDLDVATEAAPES